MAAARPAGTLSRTFVPYAVILLLLVVPLTARAATAYLTALQQRADKLHLAQSQYWQLLLHYQKNWLGGVTSAASSAFFFNAPEGRTNPSAELHATLAAFFSQQQVGARQETAQCAFPARYLWLKARLHFDPKRLPQQPCPRYRKWLKALDPGSVAVVFPTAYLNSPASMFGHTLLRIDSRDHSHSTRLLAYAVNFAANTRERNGLVFAWKGITGGYPGNFGLFPYYQKVKQYTRIENRDIWSYNLNLTRARISRLLAHLWELRGVDFRYYFFNRNCSYQLLALLAAAQPGLDPRQDFTWWTIPSDTLRALKRRPGLVDGVDYRPSRSSVLRSQAQQLTPAQRQWALRLANGKIGPGALSGQVAAAADRARILETAHDLVAYRFAAGSLKRNVAVERARKLLLARSKIEVTAVFRPPPRPATRPDQGHATARLSAGAVWADGRSHLALRLRPAYHDLLDGLGGYKAGASINFFDLGLGYSPAWNRLRIADLKLLQIISISPRNAFFRPISWRVSLGLRRSPLAPLFNSRSGNLGPYLEGGPGLAFGDADTLVGYGFLLGSGDAASSLSRGYRVGAGFRLGLITHPRPGWAVQLEAGDRTFFLGAPDHERWLSFAQQWQLARNDGLRLELRHNVSDGFTWNRIGLSYEYYF